MNFDLLLRFYDTTAHPVIVKGKTCLPIDTCSFDPVCNLKSYAADLPFLVMLLKDTSQLSGDTLFYENMPFSWIEQLDSSAYYLWDEASSTLTNPLNSFSITIQTDPPLEDLDEGIFFDIRPTDTYQH